MLLHRCGTGQAVLHDALSNGGLGQEAQAHCRLDGIRPSLECIGGCRESLCIRPREPRSLVLSSQRRLWSTAAVLQQQVLGHAGFEAEVARSDCEAFSFCTGLEGQHGMLGQGYVPFDQTLGVAASLPDDQATDAELVEEASGFVRHQAALLVGEEELWWPPEAQPQSKDGPQQRGRLLVLQDVAGFPANGLVHHETKGFVPEEEQVVLHDLIEGSGQMRLHLCSRKASCIPSAVRTVDSSLDAF